MRELFLKLSAHFDPKDVDWRVGSTNADKTRGMALAYIDARTVMDRLDEVLGPENWQCNYEVNGNKTICTISVFCDGNWIGKADGAGDTDFEADKGALSDAFKRAAVRWGIGRYLYGLGSPWVAIKQVGKSYAIEDSEKTKLAALLKPVKINPVAETAKRGLEADSVKVAKVTATLVDLYEAAQQGEVNDYAVKETVENLTQDEKIAVWESLASKSKIRAWLKAQEQK